MKIRVHALFHRSRHSISVLKPRSVLEVERGPEQLQNFCITNLLCAIFSDQEFPRKFLYVLSVDNRIGNSVQFS